MERHGCLVWNFLTVRIVTHKSEYCFLSEFSPDSVQVTFEILMDDVSFAVTEKCEIDFGEYSNKRAY